jgi:hypothetical protein
MRITHRRTGVSTSQSNEFIQLQRYFFLRVAAVVAWLRRADLNGSLSQFLHPALHPEEREIAEIEGWILGVV